MLSRQQMFGCTCIRRQCDTGWDSCAHCSGPLGEPATRAALLLALAWGPAVTTATSPTGRPRSSISLFSVLAGSVLRGEEAIPALLQRSRETFAMSSAILLGRIDADIRPGGMPSENPQQWMILGTAGVPTARCPSEADVTVPVGCGARAARPAAARRRPAGTDGVRCAGHSPGRPGLLWALGGDPHPGQRSEATAHYCLTYLPQ
jgi:hypothetical protein